MLKEIKYNSDIIEIDTVMKKVISKNKNEYDIIYSPENSEIQFLIPKNNPQVLINAETGESELLMNEDDVEF